METADICVYINIYVDIRGYIVTTYAHMSIKNEDCWLRCIYIYTHMVLWGKRKGTWQRVQDVGSGM